MPTRFEVVNQITHGRLEARFRQLHGEGLSYELIAERLRAEFDIPVTTASVYRWWKTLDPVKPTPLPRRGGRRAS